MRAIIQTGYGRPERVLQLREVDKPALEDDRVLVRVCASSVNSSDWRAVYAKPIIVRFMGGFRRPNSPATGGDFAGVVEAAGAAVSDLKAGDEVFGSRSGAYSDYVAAKVVVPKPANLTFEQAAALPVAGLTALQALRDWGKVQAGEKVLVNGAGGGVGHFAVQIAKAFGAEVTAVTSTDKIGFVRSLGADTVIDYTSEDFTRTGQRYDVIVDASGDHSFRGLRGALTPTGRVVFVGAYRSLTFRLIAAVLRRRLLHQPIIFHVAEITRPDLLALKELAEAGKLRPMIDRTYPLEQVAEAIEYAEKQRVAGKIVIAVANPNGG